MKVKDAKKIIEMVKKYKFNKDMKSLRNPSLTVLEEISIMENSLSSKQDSDVLSDGVANSFNRMKKQYEYLKDL